MTRCPAPATRLRRQTDYDARVARKATDLFLELTPERVLDAVEAAGLAVRPVCYPLNSFENRVYEVELDDRSRVVAKFYRPGRWTRERRSSRSTASSPSSRPRRFRSAPRGRFPDGSHAARRSRGSTTPLFDRKGGRAPDELDRRHRASGSDSSSARVHLVGARAGPTPTGRARRRRLRSPTTSPGARKTKLLPPRLAGRWEAAALAIADAYDRMSARRRDPPPPRRPAPRQRPRARRRSSACSISTTA